jgi:drug/metabolite transporter (DMT)-like permease
LVFQGIPKFHPIPTAALIAVVFNGVVGSAVSYMLWYDIVGQLPAATAALGSLASPAVGVVTSALILGEIPTAMDVIGFGLIFAAAMSVILQPRPRIPAAPPARDIS